MVFEALQLGTKRRVALEVNTDGPFLGSTTNAGLSVKLN